MHDSEAIKRMRKVYRSPGPAQHGYPGPGGEPTTSYPDFKLRLEGYMKALYQETSPMRAKQIVGQIIDLERSANFIVERQARSEFKSKSDRLEESKADLSRLEQLGLSADIKRMNIHSEMLREWAAKKGGKRGAELQLMANSLLNGVNLLISMLGKDKISRTAIARSGRYQELARMYENMSGQRSLTRSQRRQFAVHGKKLRRQAELFANITPETLPAQVAALGRKVASQRSEVRIREKDAYREWDLARVEALQVLRRKAEAAIKAEDIQRAQNWREVLEFFVPNAGRVYRDPEPRLRGRGWMPEDRKENREAINRYGVNYTPSVADVPGLGKRIKAVMNLRAGAREWTFPEIAKELGMTEEKAEMLYENGLRLIEAKRGERGE